MAKNPDFNLELDTKKVAQPRSFDLGIDFDALNTSRRQVQNIPNIPQPVLPGTSSQSTQAIAAERPFGGKLVLPSVGREIVQGTARGAATTGSYGTARLLGTPKDVATNITITPETRFEKAIFGQQPFSARTEGVEPLESLGVSTTQAERFGPPAVVGMTALDLFSGPGKRNIASELSRVNDATQVGRVLRNQGVDVNDIVRFGLDEKIARAQSPEEVVAVFNDVRKALEEPADSVITYRPREDGEILYTPITKRELDVLRDEIRTIPGASKQIHLDANISGLKQGGGVEVPRSVFLERVPDATTVFNQVDNIDTLPPSLAARERLIKNVLDEAELQRYIDQEVLPQTAAPRTPEAVLGRTPSPMRTIRRRESTLLRNKLREAQAVSRRAAVATRQEVKDIQNEMVQVVSDLPLKERGKFIATIKNIQTPQQLKRALPDFERRVNTALEKVAEQEQRKALRNQVRDMIRQKNLAGTENLRKALQLPSLNRMTVDDLRTFARTLAPYKPNDRFLSQRVLETLDRTNLSGMKTYREVQEKLAKEAGVSMEDLRKINVSWMDKFRYDTALARQNPFYDVVVRKINGSLVEGNIRFARFEDEFDELLRAARQSRTRSIGERLVPTDERIFKYIEAENKTDLVDDLTSEELRAANFLIERYQEAKDYLLRENVMDKYIEDYVTHIRRSGLEAYRQDGLISAIKETFEQYRVDQANFNVLNEKTGDVLPLEKFFAFAQKRTGGLKPSQNIGRASKAYFQAFERKRALDSIVPELQAYASAVTPTQKTAKGLDFDPRIKTFLKTYINNKRGRPATVLFNPGSPPDVIMRGITATTRLIDLGLSIPNFAAANVGEQVASFIGQGTKQYATGVKRMNTAQGKKIIEKYRGFVGRSPWSEIRDTSKNFPDKMMTMMLSGFHDASVRANKQGLLGALTPEEFKSGTISTERLAQIRNEMGRWRALDNSASIIGSTGEGKIFTQYKAWAVPILSSTLDNLSQFTRTASRGENPFTTRAGQELLREAVVVGTVALATYAYFDQEDDSFVGQVISKSLRDALSAIGALDPQMWVSTPRAWQYLQDLQDALRTLIMMEEYKSGEEAGTLKGDNQIIRLITPAPVRQAQGAFEGAQTASTTEVDFDLDFDDIEASAGPDFELDFDLGI